MTDERKVHDERLVALRVRLKSGEYYGTDIMAAWIAIEELIELRAQLAQAEPVAWVNFDRRPPDLHLKPTPGFIPLYAAPPQSDLHGMKRRSIEKQCRWVQDGDGGPWATTCGHYFEINDGLPSENKMAFCCYCGSALQEAPYAEDDK